MNTLKDLWEGRVTKMLCKSCIYYVPKLTKTITNHNEDGPSLHIIGRCRKNAPTIKGFVPVFPEDWCGEHRLDENKL